MTKKIPNPGSDAAIWKPIPKYEELYEISNDVFPEIIIEEINGGDK